VIDLVERSRFYGKVDTGLWPNYGLMLKAVRTPEDLTAAEQRKWVLMCTKLEIQHDVGISS
jgi:hypothetical protein